MNDMISLALDVVLIGLLIAAIVYAVKLSQHLATLRANRVDMERFVVNFNSTVMRAEASIKGLKQAARSSGDDLEQLIERAHKIAEEMHFLIERADQLASQLSDVAAPAPAPLPEPLPPAKATSAAETEPKKAPPQAAAKPASAAEQDLMQALEKLG